MDLTKRKRDIGKLKKIVRGSSSEEEEEGASNMATEVQAKSVKQPDNSSAQDSSASTVGLKDVHNVLTGEHVDEDCIINDDMDSTIPLSDCDIKNSRKRDLSSSSSDSSSSSSSSSSSTTTSSSTSDSSSSASEKKKKRKRKSRKHKKKKSKRSRKNKKKSKSHKKVKVSSDSDDSGKQHRKTKSVVKRNMSIFPGVNYKWKESDSDVGIINYSLSI